MTLAGRLVAVATVLGAMLTLAGCDLEIIKTASPNPVEFGNPLTYTLAITNKEVEFFASCTRTDVTVTDQLPDSVRFVSATTTKGSCDPVVANLLTCHIGSVAVNEHVTITVVVQPLALGVVTNTARVSHGVDMCGSEPTNNNVSTTQTTVIAAAPLLSGDRVLELIGLLAMVAFATLYRRGISRAA